MRVGLTLREEVDLPRVMFGTLGQVDIKKLVPNLNNLVGNLVIMVPKI